MHHLSWLGCAGIKNLCVCINFTRSQSDYQWVELRWIDFDMAIWKCFVISLKCKWYMGSRGKKGVATAHAPLKTSVEKAKNGQWEQEGGGYCPRPAENKRWKGEKWAVGTRKGWLLPTPRRKIAWKNWKMGSRRNKRTTRHENVWNIRRWSDVIKKRSISK